MKKAALMETAERSLFPWTHVRVDGNAVVRSISQFLLTDLCAAATGKNRVQRK